MSQSILRGSGAAGGRENWGIRGAKLWCSRLKQFILEMVLTEGDPCPEPGAEPQLSVCVCALQGAPATKQGSHRPSTARLCTELLAGMGQRPQR